MKKRFYETEAQFKYRQDVEFAKKIIDNKKLWRIYAYEMKPVNGGFQMSKQDHFSVSAYCKELAIGIFKMENMNWFVTKVEEETVID